MIKERTRGTICNKFFGSLRKHFRAFPTRTDLWESLEENMANARARALFMLEMTLFEADACLLLQKWDFGKPG
jgi:hypothetical protein